MGQLSARGCRWGFEVGSLGSHGSWVKVSGSFQGTLRLPDTPLVFVLDLCKRDRPVCSNRNCAKRAHRSCLWASLCVHRLAHVVLPLGLDPSTFPPP